MPLAYTSGPAVSRVRAGAWFARLRSMNFTSFHFVAFFFVTILLGHVLQNRPRRLFLLAASYYFYGVFEPWYLVLITSSTLWDYFAGLGIEGRRRIEAGERLDDSWTRHLTFFSPRAWLTTSLILNLGLLAYFKYTNFGIEVFNDMQPLGDSVFAWPATYILLPIGISFYTFQSLSYTIDCYRGIIKPRESLTDFALYVSFFPQLVAGPIVRAQTFFTRLDDPLPITREDILVGTTRICVGFFRKLVLSDNLAPLVNGVFGGMARQHGVEVPLLGPLDVWIGSLAFGWQIYLDFAGYTDIARGVARLFGFEFEVNFLYPMAARNIADHWRRWHISFGTWIRDYIYIPLGGSRGSSARIYFNLFVTWLFGGIWHGPAYHFIAWGIWQGVMLGAHREWSGTRLHAWLHADERPTWLAHLYGGFARFFLKFNLIFGFIWFRAENMDKATMMQGRLFGFYDLSSAWSSFWSFGDGSLATAAGHLARPENTAWLSSQYTPYIGVLILYYIYEYMFNRFQLEYFWKDENRGKLIAVLSLMILSIIVFGSPDTPDFMYFQF
jgi:D-alanyl-lipoteichoic acid acyltransferase DltB (MBOAT superfamily)